MQAPEFWAQRSATAWTLAPLGFLYGLGARLRQRFSKPQSVSVPVVCIGNLTVGGAGKTPTALAIAPMLRDMGLVPHFLTRGYGGQLSGPIEVDPLVHNAIDVGDEPLLLAAQAPCWVSRDRHRGALAAVAAGATAIVMDDGLQNTGLCKTLSLAVVDGQTGFGNGFVLPAGPLRERVVDGLKRVQGVVLVEPVEAQVNAMLERIRGSRPVFRARFAADTAALTGRKVIAFAGIARPEKFFASLRDGRCELVETVPFADHHPYRTEEIAALLERAEKLGAVLATTAKDHVRLPAEHRNRVSVVGGTLKFAQPDDVTALIERVLRGQNTA